MAENDLKRIEAGLAIKQAADAEKRAVEVEKSNQARAEKHRMQLIKQANFDHLVSRITEFKNSIHARAPCHLSLKTRDKCITFLIGTKHPLIFGPTYTIKIEALNERDRYSIVDNYPSVRSTEFTMDDIVNRISEITIQFLEKPTYYRFPAWLIESPEELELHIAGIAFLVVWILCVIAGGFAGLFLGWIPGIIVGILAVKLLNFLWPFFVVAIFYFIYLLLAR